MMSRMENVRTKAAPTEAPQQELSAEDRSKDAFFALTGKLAEDMIAAHGKDFAIGTLVLAAKFIAEGKPLRGSGSENPDK
jgi:hypothetical protein